MGHVTHMLRTKFRNPLPRRLHIKFGFDRPSSFGEEDVSALWITDDERTTTDARPWVYYKLTYEPLAQVS